MDRPFDARLSLLSDRHESPSGSGWRVVSLVTALREFLARDPDGVIPNAEQQCDLLSVCARELTDRGLDAEFLIRLGLFPEIAAGVLSSYVAQKLGAAETPGGPVTLTEARAGDWAAILDAGLDQGLLDEGFEPGASHGVRAQALSDAIGLVWEWAQGASLADLLALRPPSALPIGGEVDFRWDVEIIEQYRWIVDRFSVTNLQDWNLASLHLEFRWTEGIEESPCRSELMKDRLVDRADLNHEIARRSALAQHRSPYAGVRTSLALKMQSQALGHLRVGRFESAATLFEFAVEENPSDAAARNNLGFCLLPRDPDTAWHHLCESARLGYQPRVVNLYNRVVCLALLGDLDYALQIAEAEWDLVDRSQGLASLWLIDELGSNAVSLVERIEATAELARLAMVIARRVGNDAASQIWEERIAA